MSKFLILFLLSFLASNFLIAGEKQGDKDTKRLGQKLQNQPVHFIENGGQLNDTKGNPVPFVLFYAEAPGLNLYITEHGLTYSFISVIEEEQEEEKGEEDIQYPIHEEENILVRMERVDVELKGAAIERENIQTKGVSANSSNYFGPNYPDGIMGVRSYEKLIISDVYPGIDWILYNLKDESL